MQKLIVILIYFLIPNLSNAQSHCSDLYGCQEEQAPGFEYKEETKTELNFNKDDVSSHCSELYGCQNEQAAGFEYSNEQEVIKKEKEHKNINELAKSRDKRGKWGINFSMTKKEIEECKTKSDCPIDSKVKIGYINIDGIDFVESFNKYLFYSDVEFKKIKKSLSSKYNLVFKKQRNPKIVGDFVPQCHRNYDESKITLTEILFMFENKNKLNEPKYICFVVEAFNVNDVRLMRIRYITEDYGNELLRLMSKIKSDKEEFIDDL